MKLNLFISKSGFCSRRKAALLVKDGKVSVNNKIISEPWFEVGAEDIVKIGNKAIGQVKKYTYIIFNKPVGVTTTLCDKFAEKKIIDFIPKNFDKVYPVGRLDKFSHGLILLTNDGDLCYRMTHPKYEVEKEYVVFIEGPVDKDLPQRLEKGNRDEGDLLKVKKAFIEKSGPDKSKIKVIVCEGKKRHLRRLFSSFGLKVIDLKRVRIGKLMLGDIKEGRYRVIDSKIARLGIQN